MRICKRAFAFMLVFVMLFYALPFTVGAAEEVTINGDIKADIGDYVYYDYMLTTDLSIVNAEVHINYSADILELVAIRDERRFPNLQNINEIFSNDNIDGSNGTFAIAFTDINNESTGFEDGASFVSLVFKVKAAGNADLTSDIIYIGGRNTDISLDEKDVLDKQNGSAEDAIVVSADAPKADYDVTLPEGTGFTAEGRDFAIEGEDYTFKITADEGYDLSNMVVKVNGDEIDGTEGVYTVNGVDKALEITVEGVVKQQIPIELPEGVGFIASGDESVAYGENYTFTVSAAQGYDPDSIVVKVNGTEVAPDSDGNYVIENVTSAPEITVEGLEKIQIAVELPEGDGFTVNGDASVTYGENYTFTVDISEGYDSTDMVVKVNGTEVAPDSDGNYVIENVTSAPEIAVEGLVKIQIAVELPEGDGFTVNGDESVAYGENYTFTVDISEGYDGTDMVVKVNGTEVAPDSDGNYIVENVTSALEITVEGVKESAAFAYGDVNHDGNIDAGDATLILQRYAGIIGDDNEKYDPELADVNVDGRVDAGDATLVLQKYAGIVTVFPAEA